MHIAGANASSDTLQLACYAVPALWVRLIRRLRSALVAVAASTASAAGCTRVSSTTIAAASATSTASAATSAATTVGTVPGPVARLATPEDSAGHREHLWAQSQGLQCARHMQALAGTHAEQVVVAAWGAHAHLKQLPPPAAPAPGPAPPPPPPP